MSLGNAIWVRKERKKELSFELGTFGSYLFFATWFALFGRLRLSFRNLTYSLPHSSVVSCRVVLTECSETHTARQDLGCVVQCGESQCESIGTLFVDDGMMGGGRETMNCDKSEQKK